MGWNRLIDSAKVGARVDYQDEESDASQQLTDQQDNGQPGGDVLAASDEEQTCQQGGKMQPMQGGSEEVLPSALHDRVTREPDEGDNEADDQACQQSREQDGGQQRL